MSEVPTGVKVISVLYYIGAGFGILLGLLALFGAGVLGSISGLAILGAGVFFALGIVLLGLGILSIFIGRGLWKGKNWARVLAIIFAGLGVLIGIFSLLQGAFVSNLLNVIIQAAIGGYLLLDSNVKNAFT